MRVRDIAVRMMLAIIIGLAMYVALLLLYALFVAVIVVEVKLVMVAAVAVSASAIAVVKRPSVAKKFVLVAFVVVERSKDAAVKVDDAETMTPSVVVGARYAPLKISHDLPKVAAPIEDVTSAKVGRPKLDVAVRS